MEGPLAGFVGIGMRRIEAEQLAPVLEHEAGARGNQPAAHAAIIRLDQADHHAVAINHGEVGSVAFTLELGRNLDFAGLEFGRRLGRIDQLEAFGAIVLAEQFLRQARKIGIGIEARDIGIGEPLGFHHVVQRFGASALPLRQVDILEDIDHLQRGKALAVGRQFAQLVPILVPGTGGLDPFAAVGGKILAREGAALRLQVIDDHIGQIAVVIGIAPVAGDGFERVG